MRSSPEKLIILVGGFRSMCQRISQFRGFLTKSTSRGVCFTQIQKFNPIIFFLSLNFHAPLRHHLSCHMFLLEFLSVPRGALSLTDWKLISSQLTFHRHSGPFFFFYLWHNLNCSVETFYSHRSCSHTAARGGREGSGRRSGQSFRHFT